MHKAMHKPPTAQVLRELTVDPRKRLLARPGNAPDTRQAIAEDDAAAKLRDPIAAVEADAPPRTEPGVDEIRSRAHREGFEAGLSEGRQAGAVAGRESGLALGREEAREAAKAALDAEMKRLDAILLAAKSQLALRLEQAEDDMLELVFDTVSRLAGDLAVTRTGVRQMLQHAIAQLIERPLLKVRLHGQDLAVLRGDGDMASLLDNVAGPDRVQWIADERVQLGGFLLETADGALDVTLETQLQRVRETILETRSARRKPEGDAC